MRYCYVIEMADAPVLVDVVCSTAKRAMRELRTQAEAECGSVTGSAAGLARGELASAHDGSGEAFATAYRLPLLS